MDTTRTTMRWVKVCTKDLKCRELQLQLGDNVDTRNEYQATVCEPGGLHFCQVKFALQWANELEYDWVCDVTIPLDAEVTHGFDKSKASKLTLSNHRPLQECFDICLLAIQQRQWTLDRVPAELKTREMCLAAVQQNGWAILCLPTALDTPDMYLAAVQQNGWALMYLTPDFKTPNICFTAVQKAGTLLLYVPAELRSFGMCLAAVQQNGRALKHVPMKLMTRDLCLVAVRQDIWALDYVPAGRINAALCA